MNAHIQLHGQLYPVVVKDIFPSDGRHEQQAYVVSADGSEVFQGYSMGGPMMKNWAVVRVSRIIWRGEWLNSVFTTSTMAEKSW